MSQDSSETKAESPSSASSGTTLAEEQSAAALPSPVPNTDAASPEAPRSEAKPTGESKTADDAATEPSASSSPKQKRKRTISTASSVNRASGNGNAAPRKRTVSIAGNPNEKSGAPNSPIGHRPSITSNRSGRLSLQGDALSKRGTKSSKGPALLDKQGNEIVGGHILRMPTFSNSGKFLYFDTKGNGLKHAATDGNANHRYTGYEKDDYRKGTLPGLFSLVTRDDLHADDHGHHLPIFIEKELAHALQRDRDEEAAVREKKEQQDGDPNLVVFEGKDDPLNPQNWSFRRKALQTLLYGMSTLVCTFASSVFSSATQVVAREYNVSNEVGVLGTSLFVLGYVFGPIVWGPQSELMGRKLPLLISYFMFAIFGIPIALANNIQTVMICRFLQGFGAAGPLAIVGGGLADIWSPEARGGAIGVFSLCTLGGPAIGPLIGSFIVKSYLGWRWTMWITSFWCFANLTFLTLFMKESFVPKLLQQKAHKIRFETKNWAVHSRLDEQRIDLNQLITVYCARPFAMLIKEPMLLALTVYMSFLYGILYLLFGAVPIEMSQRRRILAGVASLPFLAVFVGACTGVGITMAFLPRYNRKMHAAKRPSVPEERTIPMMIGAVIFPIGFFLFGWTDVQYVASVWPSIIGLYLISTGFTTIFLAGLNFIIDAYLMNANSAIAANTIIRSLAGAGFPLFTTQMFNKLGVQWASTLLACLAILMAPIPFVFFKFGEKLRSKSKFAFS